MPASILATKLYIPSPRAKVVIRARLIKQLSDGLAFGRKLTIISAPAGFGKTTLISEWIANCGRPTAWLSLDDEEDNDPTRFFYLSHQCFADNRAEYWRRVVTDTSISTATAN